MMEQINVSNSGDDIFKRNVIFRPTSQSFFIIIDVLITIFIIYKFDSSAFSAFQLR